MKKGLTVNTLALGNLKSRKRQYASLITGIILAIVFSSSVLLMFSSMNASIDKMEKDLCGKQDGIYIGATQQMLNDAADKQLIGSYGYAHVVGQAFTDNGDSFAVASYDDKAAELANIQFIDGSYPQNEEEISVESATLAQLGIDASVGDRVTLNFAVQNGENHLPQVNRKTFILSGIAENKLSNIKLRYSGYENSIPTVFVAKGVQTEPGGKEMLVCYFDFYGTGAFSDEKYYDDFRAFLENEGYGTSKWIHTAIAASYFNNNTINESGTYIVFLTVILLVASCLGIVNAFSSNLNERRQQIGMLRTVGATKRQIIIIFGREALIISLISAPVSIALSCLIVKTGLLIFDGKFIFAPNIWVIVLCAVVGIACVMLAALIPLIKASNVTPVQTVRNISMTRKAARGKIKSRKSFVPSKLIAKRSLFFNGKTRAAASLILIITIVGSCYGFSALDEINDQSFSSKYGYEMDYSDNMNSLLNFPGSRTGFDYSEYSKINSIPYAGEIHIAQHCNAFMVSKEFTEYQKTVLYSDGIFSVFNDLGPYVRQMTPDNIDDYMQADYRQQYLAVQNYCAGQDILPVKIVALDNSVVREMGEYLDSGDIDLAALDSGNEVLVIAPQEIAVAAEFDTEEPDSGWAWGADTNEKIKKDKEYLKRAECDLTTGQQIGLSIVSSSDTTGREGIYTFSDPNSDEDVYPDTSDWSKTDKNVEIGALVSDIPQDFYEECVGLAGGQIVIVTTLGGMKNFYDTDYYSNINFNLNTLCTDKTDAEITQTLQSIVDSIDGTDDSFTSYYTVRSQEKQQNAALLISLLAILILFLSISASIISNSLTAQIREGRREIGTLRAVGASARELFGSYVHQLLSTLGISCVAGFAFFTVSYFIARAVITGSEYYGWFFKFNIWQTVIACVLLFAVCGINLWLRIKNEMNHSVIDNIREL